MAEPYDPFGDKPHVKDVVAEMRYQRENAPTTDASGPMEGVPESKSLEQIVGTGPSPGPDPWAHRSRTLRCDTCMWWVRKDGTRLGRCRRHSPTLSGYPATYDEDWCGDHKLDAR